MNTPDTIVAKSVEQAQENVVTLRFGRVVDVTGDTVTVSLSGADVFGVACLSSYVPKKGDWAWLLRQGSLLVAVGSSKGTVNEGVKDA